MEGVEAFLLSRVRSFLKSKTNIPKFFSKNSSKQFNSNPLSLQFYSLQLYNITHITHYLTTHITRKARTMSQSTTTTTEERALSLLGQGVPPTAVANALGVDISRISQLLSDDTFALKVVEKKFEALSKNNERDGAIDSLEDQLLAKLKETMVFMTRPMEILKSFQILNAAKRRGQSNPEALTAKQTIVQLNIPQIVLNTFTSNIHNQIVQVGEQSLVTIPSSQLLKQAEANNDANKQATIQSRVKQLLDDSTIREGSKTT